MNNYADKLNSAISEYAIQLADTEQFAKKEFENFNTNCNELFDLVLSKVENNHQKYVKLQVRYGNCRPNKSSAYIVFDNGNSTDRIELKFDDEMFRVLAFYIDKINNRNI